MSIGMIMDSASFTRSPHENELSLSAETPSNHGSKATWLTSHMIHHIVGSADRPVCSRTYQIALAVPFVH
jgi:hypothetical protein